MNGRSGLSGGAQTARTSERERAVAIFLQVARAGQIAAVLDVVGAVEEKRAGVIERRNIQRAGFSAAADLQRAAGIQINHTPLSPRNRPLHSHDAAIGDLQSASALISNHKIATGGPIAARNAGDADTPDS